MSVLQLFSTNKICPSLELTINNNYVLLRESIKNEHTFTWYVITSFVLRSDAECAIAMFVLCVYDEIVRYVNR